MSRSVISQNDRNERVPELQHTLNALSRFFRGEVKLLPTPCIFAGHVDKRFPRDKDKNRLEWPAPYFSGKKVRFQLPTDGGRYMFYIIANNFAAHSGVHNSHALIGYWDGTARKLYFFDPNGNSASLRNGEKDENLYNNSIFKHFNKDKFNNTLYGVLDRLFKHTNNFFYNGNKIPCPPNYPGACFYKSLVYMFGLDVTEGDPIKAVAYTRAMIRDHDSFAQLLRIVNKLRNNRNGTLSLEQLSFIALLSYNTNVSNRFITPR